MRLGVGVSMKDFGVVRGCPGRTGGKQAGEEKDSGSAVELDWLESPGKLFCEKRAPLSVKDVEWQAGGQRIANTTECTARTLQMQVRRSGWGMGVDGGS